jgi:prophage endopeptidase
MKKHFPLHVQPNMHKNQRGSITLIWVGAIAAAALIGAAWWWVNSYGNDRYAEGESTERSKWEKREFSEVKAANAKIAELMTAAREQESAHAFNLAAIGTQLEAKRTATTARRDTAIADARGSIIGLRIPIKPEPAACESPGASQASATPAASSGSNDTPTARLSDAAVEFLISEASRADAIVEQLTACQAVIRSDRGVPQ